MSRNIPGIFVVWRLAVLESSPRATNYLFVLFLSDLLRGMNSCIVSVDLRRGSRNMKNCFIDSSMEKTFGNTPKLPIFRISWRHVPGDHLDDAQYRIFLHCLSGIKFTGIIDYLRCFTLSTIHICVNKSVNPGKQIWNMGDFRLPPRSSWELPSSGILRSD